MGKRTETHGAPPLEEGGDRASPRRKGRRRPVPCLRRKNETAEADRMRAVAAKWGSMSDAEKAPYQRRAAEAKAAM